MTHAPSSTRSRPSADAPTSPPAVTASCSAPSTETSIATATSSSASSTSSNTSGASPPATTRQPETSSPLSSSQQPVYGCALSPRPRRGQQNAVTSPLPSGPRHYSNGASYSPWRL